MDKPFKIKRNYGASQVIIPPIPTQKKQSRLVNARKLLVALLMGSVFLMPSVADLDIGQGLKFHSDDITSDLDFNTIFDYDPTATPLKLVLKEGETLTGNSATKATVFKDATTAPLGLAEFTFINQGGLYAKDQNPLTPVLDSKAFVSGALVIHIINDDTGIIKGKIALGQGNYHFTNNNLIEGNIQFNGGVNHFINSGVIKGNITFDDGQKNMIETTKDEGIIEGTITLLKGETEIHGDGMTSTGNIGFYYGQGHTKNFYTQAQIIEDHYTLNFNPSHTATGEIAAISLRSVNGEFNANNIIINSNLGSSPTKMHGINLAGGSLFSANNVTLNFINDHQNFSSLYGLHIGEVEDPAYNYPDEINPDTRAEVNNLELYLQANNAGSNSSLTGISIVKGYKYKLANDQAPKASFTSTGQLIIELKDDTGLARNTGIFVGGGLGSQASLNNATILLNGGNENSSGLRIGGISQTYAHWAGLDNNETGLITVTGDLVIDTQDSQGVAVRVIGEGSSLNAGFAASSTTINAASTAFLYAPWLATASSHSQAILLNNAQIQTHQGEGALIKVDDGVDEAQFILAGDNSQLISHNDGWLMDIEGNSGFSFTAKDTGSMTGLTAQAAQATLTLTLADNFTWNLSPNSGANASQQTTASFNELSLTSGAALNSAFGLGGGNQFTLKGKVESRGGIINLHNSDGSFYNDVLTIEGDYSGDYQLQNDSGAKVFMDTMWDAPGDGNGANSQSDSLIITGRATGITRVIPIGPNGEINHISGDVLKQEMELRTIPVITVGNPTGQDEAAFIGEASTGGAGMTELRAYANGGEYRWYLPADPNAPGPKPYIAPASGFSQMSKANREMSLNQLGKLHERVGELQTYVWDCCSTYSSYNAETDSLRNNTNPNPLWVRASLGELKEQGRTQFGYKMKEAFVQLGRDVRFTMDDDKNHTHLGGMVSYSRSTLDFYDKGRSPIHVGPHVGPHVGKGETDLFSLGTYHTWYRANGVYLDLVGQVSYLRNRYKDHREFESARQSGYGLGVSAEVGRPFKLGNSKNNGQWLIEPQAQLAYQYIHLGSFHAHDKNTGTHLRVSGQSDGTLRGRLGARLAWNGDNGQHYTNTFYVSAHLLHDFTGYKSKAKVASHGKTDSLTERYGRTWGELQIGTQIATSKFSYLYGNVSYEHSLSGNKNQVQRGNKRAREGVKGYVGVRFTF